MKKAFRGRNLAEIIGHTYHTSMDWLGAAKTKFIMKTQTLLGHPDKFTSSELTVLKSMALGLSCKDIRKLLGLKHDKYESVFQGLFEKLGASNHYTAVKKVIIREGLNSVVKLKNNIDQYVNLRKNHHVLIYRDENHILKEEVVSFWEAIKRKKSGSPFYQMPNEDCEMVTTLHINHMFLLDVHDFDKSIEEKPRDF